MKRLHQSIDEELTNIREFKNKCTKEHEFEMAASVRDFEKRVMALRDSLV
jgi:hypothetical protein